MNTAIIKADKGLKFRNEERETIAISKVRQLDLNRKPLNVNSAAGIIKEEKATCYLDEIFSDTLPLIEAQTRKEGIHLKMIIPESIKVRVHLQQIQKVLLNIISNARFALNQKYPETHENKIVEITCEELTVDNSPFVRIIFSDRGIGIPSNIIGKVVTPFFSTKPSCLGPGLGLSISHGIITEHGGKLLISSVEGEYTRIAIDLPIAAE